MLELIKCKKCGRELEKKYFYVKKSRKYASYSFCNMCNRLRDRYGIIYSDYQNYLSRQNMKCAICFTQIGSDCAPAIDHCHKTGKVRGVLCNPCNGGLGMFKDDITLMESAIRYLKCQSS